MGVADRSRVVVVVTFIVALHVAALYAFSWRPRLDRHPDAPLAVRFLAQPQAPSEWRPPPISITEIRLHHPDMPRLVVEFSAVPSDRAITLPLPQSAPPPPDVSEDRGMPKLVAAVEYLQQPSPRYPPQSRRLREQGLVVLRVEIDEAGNACSIKIETSSGHPRLDIAAREAIERASFRPYMEDGAPRRALVLIPIEFSLNRSTA